jgi:hypothetical protein
MEALSTFPIVIELPSIKKRKEQVMKQLEQVERGISLFSRPQLHVPTSEYENTLL